MNELHKPDAEAFFGRQEMRCDAELNGRFFKVMSRGYGVLSGYGYSIARPALWLAGTISVCWGILGSYLKHGQGVEGLAAIWQGLGLSIANSFPYLGFQRLYFGSTFLAKLAPWVKI